MKNTNSFGLSSLSLKAFKFNQNCKLTSAATRSQLSCVYDMDLHFGILKMIWLEYIYDIRVDLSDYIQLLSIYI